MKRFGVFATLVAVALSAGFAWGALTVRERIFPYAIASHLLRAGLLPGATSRQATGMTPQAMRADSFALSQREVDVVLAGDSRIAEFEWQDALPQWRVANRGIGGDTVAGVLARVEGLLAPQPQVVYLMAGINDLAAGTDRDAVLASYELLLNRLARGGTDVVVQPALPCRGTPCPLTDLLWLNEELAALAAQRGYGFLNLWPDFAASDGKLRSKLTYDGVHLTPAGYALWLRHLRQDLMMRLPVQ